MIFLFQSTSGFEFLIATMIAIEIGKFSIAIRFLFFNCDPVFKTDTAILIAQQPIGEQRLYPLVTY